MQFYFNVRTDFCSGATRPLPKDGGVEKLYGDPTVGPHSKVWTRGLANLAQFQEVSC